MSIWNALLTALESVGHNKLRSLLTTLGVIIGVASVIVVVALGTGAREEVRQQFRGLGSNEVYVHRAFDIEKGQPAGKPLTYEEALGIAEACPLVRRVHVMLGGQATVSRGRDTCETGVHGVPAPTDEELAEQLAREPELGLADGEYFTEDDVDFESRVVLLGATVAEELFLDDEDPVGQTVKINRLTFQIIGVFNKRLAENPYSDPNDFVVIPISTAAADFFGRDASVFATAEVVSEKSIEEAMEQIKAYLRQVHDIDPELGEKDDFEVHSMERVVKAQQESANIFATLLGGMAAVSLTVGGIGIMNVMLVSVTERTREIGVRKALGARRWDIVQQFLLEAVALSLTGGLLGIATGILAIPAITRYNPKIAGTFTWQSVPQAFACSLLVGVAFELYPALRASWLNPIEALR